MGVCAVELLWTLCLDCCESRLCVLWLTEGVCMHDMKEDCS